MSSYYSVRSVNPKNPLVLSFDTKINAPSFTIKLLEWESENTINSLQVQTNYNQNYLTEIVDNTLHGDNYNGDHEDGTFLGQKVIIEQDITLSSEKPPVSQADGIIELDSELSRLEVGSIIFFLTSSPKTNAVIHSELGTFEKGNQEAHKIYPHVLCDENNNPLLLSIDDDSVTFILLGNEVERNCAEEPTTVYTKVTENGTVKEYQITSDAVKSGSRLRIVISNNGRIMTYSVYDKETKNWVVLRNLIFNMEKTDNNKEYRLCFETDTPNYFVNLTSNF